MPRKGPAQRRELTPDPIYRSLLVAQIVNKVMLHGKRSVAEKIVYDAVEDRRREVRRRADRLAEASNRQHQAAVGGQEPPRRWRHLPGAHGGSPATGVDVGDPLAGRLQPGASREDDGGVPRRRSARCRQRLGCFDQAPRRHAEDGREQQGLRSTIAGDLALVIWRRRGGTS